MNGGTLGPEQIFKWKQMLRDMAQASVTIRTSYHLTEPYEDWSQVRSPSRARRRMKQGHRQRVRHYQRPARKAYQINGEIWMHPEMEKHLKFVIAKQRDEYERLVIEHGQLGAMLILLGFGAPTEQPNGWRKP